MFKLKKLNHKGFTHHFIMGVIILVVGVGGVYALVRSHADQISSTSNGGGTGAIGCVSQLFTTDDEYVTSDQPCVKYGQIMLNYEISQGSLNKYGVNSIIAVDGQYGPLTQAAVVAFQKLSQPIDGSDGALGQYTWAKLCYYLGNAAPSGGPSNTSLTYRNAFVGADCIYANTAQVSAPHWSSTSTTTTSTSTSSSVRPATGTGSGVGPTVSTTTTSAKSGSTGKGATSTATKTPTSTKPSSVATLQTAYSPGCYITNYSPTQPIKKAAQCPTSIEDQNGQLLLPASNCYSFYVSNSTYKLVYERVSCNNLYQKVSTIFEPGCYSLMAPSGLIKCPSGAVDQSNGALKPSKYCYAALESNYATLKKPKFDMVSCNNLNTVVKPPSPKKSSVEWYNPFSW